MNLPRPVSAAPTMEPRPWSPSQWGLVVVLAVAAGMVIGIVVSQFVFRGDLAQYRWEVWRWEADNVLDNAFARVGIGPEPDPVQGEDALRRYFELTSQIHAANDTESPDLALIDTLTNERAVYENDVERVIERWIDEAVTSAGLQRPLPVFNGVRITWPPVDFELTSPPTLLVRSPRDHIERVSDTLLKNDLSLRQIETIEADTSNDDTVTIVVGIGGLAAYPAVVRDDRSYNSMLDTASHEWVHHYLAFYPLGEQWGEGGDAEALNETTANVAGREIANLIRAAHPMEFAPGTDGSGPARPAPTVNFSEEMRSLRLQVDDLLAQGKVAEAERLMEDKRKYLAENGITIRKLNQAYFAFYGTYADTPASSNPIGPKIEQVWDATKDVGTFLALMRDITSPADLDALLASLGH